MSHAQTIEINSSLYSLPLQLLPQQTFSLLVYSKTVEKVFMRNIPIITLSNSFIPILRLIQLSYIQ